MITNFVITNQNFGMVIGVETKETICFIYKLHCSFLVAFVKDPFEPTETSLHAGHWSKISNIN